MTARFCATCGTGIPEGARFCPRCGAEVLPPKAPAPDALAETVPAYVPPAAPPIAAAPPISQPARTAPPATPPPPFTPAQPTRTSAPPATAPDGARMSRSAWGIGVPIAIAALGLLIWALLAGMPFGGDRDRVTRAETPAMETIGEGTPPAGSNSRELTVPDHEQALESSTAATPRTATTSAAPATTTTSRRVTPPVTVPPAAAARDERATDAPARRESAPAEERRTPQGEITQSQAAATLRGYLTSRGELGVSADCLEVSTVEYKNRGYTMNAADRCDEKSLGRWRVDSLTREIFRQQSDGRYLRP